MDRPESLISFPRHLLPLHTRAAYGLPPSLFPPVCRRPSRLDTGRFFIQFCWAGRDGSPSGCGRRPRGATLSPTGTAEYPPNREEEVSWRSPGRWLFTIFSRSSASCSADHPLARHGLPPPRTMQICSSGSSFILQKIFYSFHILSLCIYTYIVYFHGFSSYFLLPEGKDDEGKRRCEAHLTVVCGACADRREARPRNRVARSRRRRPSAQVELRPTSRLPDGLRSSKGKSMSKKPETGRNKRYPAYIRQCAGSCAGEILAAAEERTGKLWDVA